MKRLPALLAAGGLALACATPSPAPEVVATGPVRVDRIAANPRVIDPSTEVVEFSYWTAEPVSSRLLVHDGVGDAIAELSAAPSREEVKVRWEPDGLRNGVYTFEVQTLTAAGWRSGTPPAAPRKEVLAQRFQFDRETLEASFILPEPAFVVLRVGTQAVPLLRTVLDWTPLASGSHRIQWDGLDSSGQIRVGLRNDMKLGLRAFSLPDRYVIAQEFDESGSRGDPRAARPQGVPCMQAVLTEGACREPDFHVQFVDAVGEESDRPAVRDRAIVRVSLGAGDRELLIRSRFEVMFFIDSVFLFEEEQATDPLNYTLDVSGLPPGEHLLTVNVIGYDDRLSVRSVPFVVLSGENS